MSVSTALRQPITDEQVERFQLDGYLIHPESVLDEESIHVLRQQLSQVLNGVYDLGQPPYKVTKIPQQFQEGGQFVFSSPQRCRCDGPKSRTIHMVNIWRSSSAFQSLVTSPALGTAVMRLMKWERYGCRVAQDQVWIKPPHSLPLTYHRDTPYIDFDPKEVCTVWMPLDDIEMSDSVGTLEYCAGSHRWSATKRGSANQFYSRDYTALLQSAAEEECRCSGTMPNLDITKVTGAAGCCSFHNGNTWHGSAENRTCGWRRGIGIHFVRGDAVLAGDAGKMWRDLLPSGASMEHAFPTAAVIY